MMEGCELYIYSKTGFCCAHYGGSSLSYDISSMSSMCYVKSVTHKMPGSDSAGTHIRGTRFEC